eukprot:1139441-Pelagomonas_calceolata.AAC.2
MLFILHIILGITKITGRRNSVIQLAQLRVWHEDKIGPYGYMHAAYDMFEHASDDKKERKVYAGHRSRASRKGPFTSRLAKASPEYMAVSA